MAEEREGRGEAEEKRDGESEERAEVEDAPVCWEDVVRGVVWRVEATDDKRRGCHQANIAQSVAVIALQAGHTGGRRRRGRDCRVLRLNEGYFSPDDGPGVRLTR